MTTPQKLVGVGGAVVGVGGSGWWGATRRRAGSPQPASRSPRTACGASRCSTAPTGVATPRARSCSDGGDVAGRSARLKGEGERGTEAAPGAALRPAPRTIGVGELHQRLQAGRRDVDPRLADDVVAAAHVLDSSKAGLPRGPVGRVDQVVVEASSQDTSNRIGWLTTRMTSARRSGARRPGCSGCGCARSPRRAAPAAHLLTRGPSGLGRERPVADDLLVVGRLRSTGCPVVARPEARRVGCEHLVAEHHGAVGSRTELQLGVGQDDAPLARHLLGPAVEGEREITQMGRGSTPMVVTTAS